VHQFAPHTEHSLDPAGNAVPQLLQKVTGRSLGPQSWKRARFPGVASPHQAQNCAPGVLGVGARGAAAAPAPGPAADAGSARGAATGSEATIRPVDGPLGAARPDWEGIGPSASRACRVPDTGQREKANTR